MSAEIEQHRKNLGVRLEEIRDRNGLSTYYITKNFGIRFEEIQAIEKGLSNYTVDTLLFYCEAIGAAIIPRG